MSYHSALALDILDNMDKYTVNPVEKMNRTIDKMCDNHSIKIEKGMTGQMASRDAAELRGYGNGRNQGD